MGELLSSQLRVLVVSELHSSMDQPPSSMEMDGACCGIDETENTKLQVQY